MAGFLRPTVSILLLAVLACPAHAASSSGTGLSDTGARATLPAPELLSPANDSWLIERPLVLCWTYPYNGLPVDEVSFSIQIDNNQDCTSPEVLTGLGAHNLSFTPTSEISNDGSYFWRVGAKYNSTESPWSAVRKFNLDAAGPYIGSPSIKSWNGYTADRNITIVIRAKDPSGVAAIRYSFDKSNWSEWVPYAEEYKITLGADDGKWSVYVQVRDRFGHWSQSSAMRIVLDTKIPVGEIFIDNNSTFAITQRVLLDLPANDTNGIRNVTISNSPDFPEAAWIAYNRTLEWDLPREAGWHTVYAKFRDPAGHESLTASASILLDNIPPNVNLTINSGARYTNSRNVTLAIEAFENVGVGSMMLAGSPELGGSDWLPFDASTAFELPPGDGLKSVYVRLRDNPGNIGDPDGASIILDTTPPVTVLSLPERLSPNRSLSVSWYAADTTSGVHSYDVEYREGSGTWTAWLSNTTLQRARFNGTDGAAYSFRAGATDQAGNVGPFTDGSDTVTIDVPGPLVDIRWPSPGATLSGTFTISGSASARAHDTAILTVQVRIDNDTWQAANGTSSWDLRLETSKLHAGKHNITARASDGTKYSPEATRQFYVERASGVATAGPGAPYAFVASGLLVLVAAMAVLLSARRKK